AGSSFTIDLGTPHRIAAFSYTPPTATSEGTIARGTLQTSADGKKWTTAGTFEFGNLVNDPTTRLHTLAKPITARFFRIVADASEGGSKVATIAEIDLFE
ncbi:MAG: discoidin domain-containing protein, partial [Muribaculaceae bacterium]|nr:discoidin domain-containing protein [Muribaculaceae bacterium]